MIATRHQCAQAGCDNNATHVVIESSYLSLLFISGAGLLCEDCARMMSNVGGIVISLTSFIEAAKTETINV